jgi:hypothetical protein
MISMSSSLAKAGLYHNMRRIRFNGGMRMSGIRNRTADILAWFGLRTGTIAILNIAILA